MLTLTKGVWNMNVRMSHFFVATVFAVVGLGAGFMVGQNYQIVPTAAVMQMGTMATIMGMQAQGH